MNDHWETRVKNISHNNYKKFFPEINKVFRHKNQLEIPCLHIPENNINLLNSTNINKNNLTKDSKNNYQIQEIEQKLIILGSHFAMINNQNINLGKPRLNEIIINETEKIKKETELDKKNNTTICIFNESNTADMPTDKSITPYYFTNNKIVSDKIKYLNRKKSSGLDGLPNIILKHIPAKIILLVYNSF